MQEKRHIPVWVAVCGGWFCAYLLLFVYPVFLNTGHVMSVPPPVPVLNPIGADLRTTLGFSRTWLETGNPCAGYPPLSAVGFALLTALPFPAAYALMVATTLLAFISVALVLPLMVFERSDRAAVVAVALAGLFSYGLQFEFERGQSNVLVMACVAWGLFLFHRSASRGTRWVAYALLSAAIQFKLYPAIFVFAFAKDARAWKQNLARWAALGAVNVALLFALGPRAFADFFHLLKKEIIGPYVWAGNHSIQGFAMWVEHPWIVPAFAAVYAACFLWALGCQIRFGRPELFAGLILMSALGAMLIPSESHDYKLPIFTMAFAFFVGAAESLALRGLRMVLEAGLFVAIGIIHAWTLFSYMVKPVWLQNNTPFLLATGVGLAVWMGSKGNKALA